MNKYKSNRNIILVIDIVVLTISFLLSLRIRFDFLGENIVLFFAGTLLFTNAFRMLYRLCYIKNGEQIPANYEKNIGLKSSTSE